MISIIVSTRDRPDRLEQCVESLARAARPRDHEVEIVVVDNGRGEGAREVCRTAQQQGAPVRLVQEPQPGLSHARNRGVRESRGEVVAFTDDDCLVAPDWLVVLEREFADPGLGVCGGRVELHDPLDLPIAIYVERERATVIHFGQIFLGCNMAARRAALERTGPFDPLLGAGSPTLSAEDTDFLYRSVLSGTRVLYVPDLVVRHAHGRRGANELARINRGYVVGRGAFYCKHILRGSGPILGRAVREVLTLARNTVAPAAHQRRDPSPGQRLRGLATGAWRYLST